jgi:putative addiction module antidote
MAYVTRLSRQGNSLGVRIPGEFLRRLGLAQGDSVSLDLQEQRIQITRADDDYNRAMGLGKECGARYRRALGKLAK